MQVGVIGAGVMGVGIVIRLTTHGVDVVLVDSNQLALNRALEEIAFRSRFNGLSVASGSSRNSYGTVRISDQLNDLCLCPIVIETISEELEAKTVLYKMLGALLPPRTLVATNTSVMPVDYLASLRCETGYTVGIHFMNPAESIDHVELVFPNSVGPAARDTILALLERLKLSHTQVEDSIGFVSNRVLMPMINEACKLLSETGNSPSTVDSVFREAMGHKMGPLETADLIGLDTVFQSLKNLEHFTGNSLFHPASTLTDRVAKGLLGAKTGSGFYEY